MKIIGTYKTKIINKNKYVDMIIFEVIDSDLGLCKFDMELDLCNIIK